MSDSDQVEGSSGSDQAFTPPDAPTRARGKRSTELEAAIILNIETAMPKGSAAEAAGISRMTLWQWEHDDPEFAQRLVQAEANAKRRLLALQMQAAMARTPSSHQAIEWLLSRRWPDEFGEKSVIEISIDLRAEAERLAGEHGLTVDDVMAEADAIVVASARKR